MINHQSFCKMFMFLAKYQSFQPKYLAGVFYCFHFKMGVFFKWRTFISRWLLFQEVAVLLWGRCCPIHPPLKSFWDNTNRLYFSEHQFGKVRLRLFLSFLSTFLASPFALFILWFLTEKGYKKSCNFFSCDLVILDCTPKLSLDYEWN